MPRLPERPAGHGLIQVVDIYPLHGCVMVVIAAADTSGVPADEARTVRAALAYVPGRLGLVGGCVCAWVLPGEPVQDGRGKDLAFGAVDIGSSQFTLTVLY